MSTSIFNRLSSQPIGQRRKRSSLPRPPTSSRPASAKVSSTVFDRLLAGTDNGSIKFRHVAPEQPTTKSVHFQGFSDHHQLKQRDARRARHKSLHKNFRLPTRADRRKPGAFSAFSTAARHAHSQPQSPADSGDERADDDDQAEEAPGTPHKDLEEYLSAVLNVDPQRHSIAQIHTAQSDLAKARLRHAQADQSDVDRENTIVVRSPKPKSARSTRTPLTPLSTNAPVLQVSPLVEKKSLKNPSRSRMSKLERERNKLEKLVVKQQRFLNKHKSQIGNLQNELKVAQEGKDLLKAENAILRRNMAFLKRNMRQHVEVRAEQMTAGENPNAAVQTNYAKWRQRAPWLFSPIKGRSDALPEIDDDDSTIFFD